MCWVISHPTSFQGYSCTTHLQLLNRCACNTHSFTENGRTALRKSVLHVCKRCANTSKCKATSDRPSGVPMQPRMQIRLDFLPASWFTSASQCALLRASCQEILALRTPSTQILSMCQTFLAGNGKRNHIQASKASQLNNKWTQVLPTKSRLFHLNNELISDPDSNYQWV